MGILGIWIGGSLCDRWRRIRWMVGLVARTKEKQTAE